MARGRKPALPHNSKSLLAASDRLNSLAFEIKKCSGQLEENAINLVMINNPTGIEEAFKTLQKFKRDIELEISKAKDERISLTPEDLATQESKPVKQKKDAKTTS